MSRVGQSPVTIPSGVEVSIANDILTAKGKLGELSIMLTDDVKVEQADGTVTVKPMYSHKRARQMWGTARSVISNLVEGVSEGFTKKLEINGVGYRAKATGSSVNLTVGLSHPVDYTLPEGVTAGSPSQTEIVVKGIDKQAVGQAAAKIRSYRPPEPYKGKGISYADEYVRRKEAKKQ